MSENIEESKSKKSKGPYCCANNCKMCKGRDNVGFYKVKRNKDERQTEAWANAIKRSNPDGSR